MVRGGFYKTSLSNRCNHYMPWKSTAQARWGHSPSGKKALGSKGVAEWDAATPKGSLEGTKGSKKSGWKRAAK
jgi:hypothetical protein